MGKHIVLHKSEEQMQLLGLMGSYSDVVTGLAVASRLTASLQIQIECCPVTCSSPYPASLRMATAGSTMLY